MTRHHVVRISSDGEHVVEYSGTYVECEEMRKELSAREYAQMMMGEHTYETHYGWACMCGASGTTTDEKHACPFCGEEGVV